MMRIEHVLPSDAATPATAIRPAERLLLDIIDTVREPLLVLDADFSVTHTNRAFFRAFRVSPDETIGRSLFALGDGQWDIAPLRALRGRLAAESELFDYEVDHAFPTIGRKVMLLNARRVSHGPGVPRTILLAFEDVTDQRLADRQRAAQRRELQRSNDALNDFAFVASHDLQEPLRKIVSFGERLETAAGPLLDGNARLYLERMLDAAARMRTLINDVLAYSQVSTSTQPYVPIDLTTVARDVAADLEATSGGAGSRIEIGELPVIEGDASQMRQLLQNLLGNALKFRRQDVPPFVQVAASPTADGWCTLSVRDNGIGFKEEYGDRIFRMFERLHNRAKYDGSGIGLAICRKIVERHGGTIAATSAPGEGATFSITLPLSQAHAGDVR